MKKIRTARPSWDTGLIVVCRKCDGSPKSLRRDLKEMLAARGLRGRIRVVESGCLDLCPKRGTAVVAIAAKGRDVFIIPAGTHDAAALGSLLRPFERASREPISDFWEPSPERARS